MEFKKIMEEIEKTGEIIPGKLNVGGVLKPEDADKLIDLVVKESDFLQEVNVIRSERLSKDVDVWDIADRILVRVPEGEDPTSFAGISNVGKRLELKDVQLFGRITFSFLRDNRGRPGIEDRIVRRWARKFGEDLVLLGFEGVGDDGSDFSHLNTGWVALAENSTEAHKVNKADFTDATTGKVDWHEFLKAIVSALPAKYKSDRCRIIMNPTDYEEFVWQFSGMEGGVNLILSGETRTFMGYQIRRLRACPQGTVLFTPLPNLVFGISRQIERYREVKASKRCIDYTFVVWCDYQIAVDDAVVIGK